MVLIRISVFLIHVLLNFPVFCKKKNILQDKQNTCWLSWSISKFGLVKKTLRGLGKSRPLSRFLTFAQISHLQYQSDKIYHPRNSFLNPGFNFVVYSGFTYEKCARVEFILGPLRVYFRFAFMVLLSSEMWPVFYLINLLPVILLVYSKYTCSVCLRVLLLIMVYLVGLLWV